MKTLRFSVLSARKTSRGTFFSLFNYFHKKGKTLISIINICIFTAFLYTITNYYYLYDWIPAKYTNDMETKNNKKKSVDARKKELESGLPKKLNKLGEWFMSESKEGLIIINDMKAVLK